MLVADLGEDAGVGREAGLAAPFPRQAELLEEDAADLLWRADRELLLGQLEDLLLQGGDPLAEAGADLGQPLGVELQALAFHRREDVDQRQLDVAQQRRQVELGESRPLGLDEGRDQARLLGRVEAGLDLLAERELPVVPGALGGRALGEADAGVGRQLGQLVGAALRLQQVGGEHRVVVQRQLDPLAGGGGEQSVAAAAERLRVVGGERMGGEGDRQLVERRGAGEDPLPLGGGPAVAGDRQRHRALAEIAGRPLLDLDRQLLLDPAAGNRLALGKRLFQPLHHRPQLELAHEVAQDAAVGLRRHRLPQVDARVDVVLERRQLLRHARVVGVLDQVLLALGAGDLLDARQDSLQRAEPLQQLGGRLLADPGDAGDVVGGVAAQPHQVDDQLRRHPVALDDGV